MFYIATTIHGRGVRFITGLENKEEFYAFVDDDFARRNASDSRVKKSATIDDLCAALYDNGPGTGSRSHRRISRKDAIEALENGAEPNGFAAEALANE
jgi:hypothetical protein